MLIDVVSQCDLVVASMLVARQLTPNIRRKKLFKNVTLTHFFCTGVAWCVVNKQHRFLREFFSLLKMCLLSAQSFQKTSPLKFDCSSTLIFGTFTGPFLIDIFESPRFSGFPYHQMWNYAGQQSIRSFLTLWPFATESNLEDKVLFGSIL